MARLPSRGAHRAAQDDPAEQDLEIRKRLKVQKPGETQFILPETAKPVK